MTTERMGTIVPTDQSDNGFTVTRYWVGDDHHVATEAIGLAFADASEFKDFLRSLERWGRKRCYLRPNSRSRNQ